ncbi:MAG: MFS transporter [Rickettsiaceae bacterium]|nr:MAG: MFS transporter [Rickettsiaceae bacterium]
MKKDFASDKVIGAFLGTIVEYYDYSLYGFSAAIIAAKFFPSADHLTSLANVFAVYALTYISKPLGSVIFGHIGDIYGRKKALSITIVGIAAPTTVIGVLPEYSSIGIISTLILILCRLLQSIFIAGEYDGAAIYVIEHLGHKNNFIASAVTRSTGVLGLLIGISCTNFFNAHIFPEWGWRIPFLLSLPLSFVTLYYRVKLEETLPFEQALQHENIKSSLTKLIQRRWRDILAVILFAGGFGVTYQIPIIFMKQYLPMIMPSASVIISSFSVLLVLCFGVTMPISGFLADRYGAIKVMGIGLCGTIISGIIFIVATYYQTLNLCLAACLLLSCSVAPFNALAHGIIVGAFSVRQRYSAISLAHTIGSMLMSGTANYICLQVLKRYNMVIFPIIYVMFFATCCYLMTIVFTRLKSYQ